MPKKPCVRTLMASQHVKGSERLLKQARHYFSNISLITLIQIQHKNFSLVISDILRLFVNMLTPDDKYSLSVKATV